MAYRLLGIVAALVLLALNTNTASAKQPSFIITGGELGEYAAVVSSPWPEGPYLPFGAPMSQLELMPSPDVAPSLRYDVYNGGLFGVASGPSYHYYPAGRILYDAEYDRWFDVLPDWAAFMESAIGEALAERERGELEIGPIAAALRKSRIPEGTVWLRSYSPGEGLEHAFAYETSLSFDRCPECTPLPRGAEQFAMRDMVETLSREPITKPSSRPPAYAMEYYSAVGRGGVGGLVGYYAPPEGGEPGRFWPPGYKNDSGEPYYETTPGFDRTISNAFAFWQTSAGNLEDWVSAAQLRNMRLPEATFLLRHYAVPGQGYNFQGSGECPRCLLMSGPNVAFVMGDLAEVMQGPLVGPASEMPPYAIEYEIPNPPDGFIRQLLGMYRPPENGAPGQFWFRQYSRATLYRETTPGFDAVIADALARSEPWNSVPDDRVVLESESGGGLSMRPLISGLAGGAVVFLAGSAILYRRRTA